MKTFKNILYFLLITIGSSQVVEVNISEVIKGEKYKLYEAIDVDIADDILYVLDKGNKNVKVIDLKKHKTLFVFGEEGNGPGKIKGSEKIIVHDDRIYLYNFSKIAALKLDGTFISQSSNTLANNYELTINKNNELLRYHINDLNGYPSYIKYDKDLNEIERKEFQKSSFKETNFDEEHPSAKRLIRFYNTPKQIFFNNENIMFIYKGKFNVGVLNSETNYFHNIRNNSFEDIEIPDDFQYRIWMPDPKKLEAAKILLTSLYRKIRDNNQDNIDEYSGSINKYSIYRINTEIDYEFTFAVFDNDNFIKTFNLTLDKSENLKIIRTKIKNNKLYIFYKNDTDGPSVNIYDINIK